MQNTGNLLVASYMTSTMTTLHNDGKNSLSWPPDLERTEKIHLCVVNYG